MAFLFITMLSPIMLNSETGRIAMAQNANGSGMPDYALPYNIEAEKSVLAACILNGEVLEEALARLMPESFFRPAHRIMFEAMRSLNMRNVPVDQISLAENLAASKQLDAIGGRSYIVEVADNTFSLTSWNNHIEIVHRTAVLRKLILAGSQISTMAASAPDDLKQAIEDAERTLFAVTEQSVRTSFEDMNSLLLGVFEEISELAAQGGKLRGVPTGFADADRLFHGLRGGNLVILAARPSVGKTAFALNVAVNAARRGYTVAFFSLEMSSRELATRILCSEARVSISKVNSGNIATADWPALADACERLSGINLLVDADDAAGLTVLDARTKARRALKDAKGKGLIIIDYLQLMTPSTARKDGNRNLEVAEISRGLKMLAKELDVPIIALSQLSRDIEKRPDKTPRLSDLRDSGSIEQDADIVMFIDRSISEEEAEKSGRPEWGTANLIVAKHRNGAVGEIPLSYIDHITKFMSMADDSRAW